MSSSRETIAGYFPVIHEGYLHLLDSHLEAEVGVLANEVLNPRFSYLRKDIRALPPERAIELLSGIGRSVRLIGETGLVAVMQAPGLIMPDDDVSHALAEEFDANPTFAPVFLRWDRKNASVNVEVIPHRTVELSADNPIIQMLYEYMEKSTNWWRHLAAAIVKDGQVLAAHHNSSVPTAYSSAIDSDPRITANRGVSIETSIDMHAEAHVIAKLAREGVSTEGSELYVTTFPCPNCAKLIAESGVKACYFTEGYSMIDGQSILEVNDVEIVKIITDAPVEKPGTFKPYPTN